MLFSGNKSLVAAHSASGALFFNAQTLRNRLAKWLSLSYGQDFDQNPGALLAPIKDSDNDIGISANTSAEPADVSSAGKTYLNG
jgi:hypothetical protein